MKVFVTGGTGFVVKNTVKRLVESGHECSCLVRSTSKKDAAMLSLRPSEH